MNAAAVKSTFFIFLFEFLNPARPAARVLKNQRGTVEDTCG
jgi:hypothetical protein